MKGFSEDILKIVTIPLALLGGIATVAKFLETRYDKTAALTMASIFVPLGILIAVGAGLVLLPLWRKIELADSDQAAATLAALKITTYRLVGLSLLIGAVAVAVSLWLGPRLVGAFSTPTPTAVLTTSTPPTPTQQPPSPTLQPTSVPTPRATTPTPEQLDQPCLTDAPAPTWRFLSSDRRRPKINTDVGCFDLSPWGLYPRVQSNAPYNTTLHIDSSTTTSTWAAVRYIPLKNDQIHLEITISSMAVERKDRAHVCPSGDPCDLDLFIGIGSRIDALRGQEPTGRFITLRVFEPEGPIRACAISTIYDTCSSGLSAPDHPLESLPFNEVITITLTGSYAEFYVAGVLVEQYDIPAGSKALWVGYSAYTQAGFASAALVADIEFISPALFQPRSPSPIPSPP